MDNVDQRDVARADPPTFISAAGTPLVIDEVRRVGDPLVLAIKAQVDQDDRPGQFLVTGSTNFLTVPSIAETLAGRADIVTLWPLSQGELRSGSDDVVDRVFGSPEQLLASRYAATPRSIGRATSRPSAPGATRACSGWSLEPADDGSPSTWRPCSHERSSWWRTSAEPGR